MASPIIRIQPKPQGDMFSLFAALAAVVGLIAGWVGAKELWKSVQVLSWPTVQGTLGTGEVRAWEVDRRTGRTVAYEALVRCSYEVKGTSYVCNRIHPVEQKFNSPEDARKELLSATNPTVHYNPADPSDSCLTVLPNTRCLWCLGACITGVGLLVFAIWRQKRRTRNLAAEFAAQQRMVDQARGSGDF